MLILRMAFLVPAIVDFAIAALTLYRMIGVVDDSLVPRGQFAGAAFCWGLLLLLGAGMEQETRHRCRVFCVWGVLGFPWRDVLAVGHRLSRTVS